MANEEKKIPASTEAKKPDVPKTPDPKAPPTAEVKKPEVKTTTDAEQKKPDPVTAPPVAEVKKPEAKDAPDAEKKPAAVKAPDTKAAPAAEAKKSEAEKTAEAKKEAAEKTPTGPAAAGPAGVAITQVLKDKLQPPTEKDIAELPLPKEGEAFFGVLHPKYLVNSDLNRFSVDTNSENFKELLKSIEQNGIKEPVKARPRKDGKGIEIVSGQRRHIAATMLGYPVPAIIERIDDEDAKIQIADGNLHRDKISSYDLSRSLRMKMDAMKQKAGRRRKDDPSLPKLDSDEAIAKEMGISVPKLNRIVRLSEAEKVICDRVDDGSLALSIASAISFLKPETQSKVSDLMDINYKVSTDRIERMKKAEKSGKLTDSIHCPLSVPKAGGAGQDRPRHEKAHYQRRRKPGERSDFHSASELPDCLCFRCEPDRRAGAAQLRRGRAESLAGHDLHHSGRHDCRDREPYSSAVQGGETAE